MFMTRDQEDILKDLVDFGSSFPARVSPVESDRHTPTTSPSPTDDDEPCGELDEETLEALSRALDPSIIELLKRSLANSPGHWRCN